MSFYVYKFVDKYNNVIYIGKTENIKNRIHNQHFTINGHLNEKVYLNTSMIYYAELISHEEMNIYERYLINTLNPIYNKKMNNNSKFGFQLPELSWKQINFSKDKFLKQLKLQNNKKENEANINIQLDNYSKEGYLLINNENTKILNLKIKREILGSINEKNFEKQNPYCRYILINTQRYFCISDIESVIFSSINTSSKTLQLLKNNIIQYSDILVLNDKTLNNIHIKYGLKLRFGSENWLKNRILQQVELNKRKYNSDTYGIGWTKELKYLYNTVLNINLTIKI